AFENGSQTATLRRVEGAQAAGTGDDGQVIVASAQVSMGRDAYVTEAGEYRFFAGWRSDPFFFDVQGMLNHQQFTGDDFFADKDVCGIVLEVPNSDLATKRMSLWARTLIGARGAEWVQVDRGALPAQAVFLVGTERDAYLAGEPADDARFIPVFAHSLEHLGGYTPDEAREMAGTLLPEILPYDPTCAASFPTNGRTLTDDAGDVFVAALTNGKVTEDKVGPHRDLLPEFPYLGPPHNEARCQIDRAAGDRPEALCRPSRRFDRALECYCLGSATLPRAIRRAIHRRAYCPYAATVSESRFDATRLAWTIYG